MKKCSICERQATHILVDYYRNVIDHDTTYCELHAFHDGREMCPCCPMDGPVIETYNDNDQVIYLYPTYPVGALDREGCCSEHP